jgi:hypothetical protein
VSVLRRAALGLLLALAAAVPAHADGDPASDVLVPPDVRVYMTNGARDAKLEQRIQQTATDVSDAGLPIKVAIIGNVTDLGAVPQLWAQPQVYARFLGAELRFIYKDTLLIVMPQGFGINGPFPQQRALTALAGIDPRVDTSPEGLTESADRALRALAKADGRTLPSSGGAGGIPFQFIAAAVMVVAGVGGALLILRLGKPGEKTGDAEG